MSLDSPKFAEPVDPIFDSEHLYVTIKPERTKKIVPMFTLVKDTLDEDCDAIAAIVNNQVLSLMEPLNVNCSIKPIFIGEQFTQEIVYKSLMSVLCKASHELFPDACLQIQFDHKHNITYWRQKGRKMTTEDVDRLRAYMREIIADDIPITKGKVSYREALEIFKDFPNTLRLIRGRYSPFFYIQRIGTFVDLWMHIPCKSTGVLGDFELTPYEGGVYLHGRSGRRLEKVNREIPPSWLFELYIDYVRTSESVGADTVAWTNSHIKSGDLGSLIMRAEAFHEEKFAKLAARIQAETKVVFIAGPSSSGKTTFSNRLCINLRANGLRPQTISLDHFYADYDSIPLGDDGKPDLEDINSLCLDKLKAALTSVVDGTPVEVPHYNFKLGKSEKGETLILPKNSVVIIEGIHALNPMITGCVPHNRQTRVFIRPMSCIRLDDHHYIQSVWTRFLRRMVRDYLYRGCSVDRTLELWPSVRAGEKKWIFPYMETAHFFFNSTVMYELNVLTLLARPNMKNINPKDPNYPQIRLLAGMLEYVLAAQSSFVPAYSLLCEFLPKGSIFNDE